VIVSHDKMIEYYERQIGYLKKRKARKKPVMAEDNGKRRHIWRHNSFKGHCAMMEKQLEAIVSAPSTTEITQYLADVIKGYVTLLRKELDERIDP
jgi:hypothetical protein